MGIRSLVSVGFLVLPIAVTLGILLGLQALRQSQGMPPPFVSNKVETKTYCQRAFGISPATHGLQYTREFSPFATTDYPSCFDIMHDSPKINTPVRLTSVELIEFAVCS